MRPWQADHVERVTRIRAGFPPTLAVAGAAYGGVSIPDCIRQGQEAGAQILTALGARPSGEHLAHR